MNVVKFDCPKCGTESLAETVGGTIVPSPPKCALGHVPTEMEQRLLPERLKEER